MRRVVIVRHTEVARRWRGRCYGRTDVGLSREGYRAARALAQKLAAGPIDAVLHSGLARARFLANEIGRRTGFEPSIDPRWMERDFGSWEGRSWQSIWRESGDEMDGMLTHPHSYRPGGGETTHELAKRAVLAWTALPRVTHVVVITHGGPIAAVRAHLEGRPFHELARCVIPEGEFVQIICNDAPPTRQTDPRNPPASSACSHP